jgi:uncharacterized protein YkwD
MTTSRFLAVAFVVLTAGACSVPGVGSAFSPAAASPSGRYRATEARIFDLINAERKDRGLPPLLHNEQLDRMASIQAQNMAYFQRMAHVLPEAKLPTLTDRAYYVAYPFGQLAENIALGYPDAETVVHGWMTSKGHRANILHSEVEETGIAIAKSSTGAVYYCQVFGRRASSL